jgi:hypothetical protein
MVNLVAMVVASEEASAVDAEQVLAAAGVFGY